MKLIISNTPTVMFISIFSLTWVFLYVFRKYYRSKNLRLPFTQNLLRSPGQSLLKKVDFINQEITIYAAYLFLGPISVYAIYVSHLYFNKRVPSLLSLGFFSAFVALPGWFVMRTSSEGIPVLNPILFRSLLKQIQPQNLSEKTIKRIVHQLEQKCRDVEPTSNIAEQD